MEKASKQKLIAKRKAQGLSQAEMAYKLNMEQSQYSRRETGETKITLEEWEQMAKLLDCQIEGIYEPNEKVYIIKNENTSGNFGNHNICQNHSEFALDTMKKYIEKLEQENKALKKEIKRLKKSN